ncbi:hypothetical protein RGUI_0705 [Rhodovulum sp. P5]|uniref:hypothetical protein n=1 Tax=Rhodovulum sp. P5 TaxID=1564506 RepID=UPI0009C36049|nr:hypothetical protein [Rhodovulum sp. P5]ARE38846.1 hypothetical protein RGUI_0705 [Rhodovulum sp. P5]
MVQTLIAITAVAMAVTLFQTSVLLIGGFIGKEMLAPFYRAVPTWWQRMLLVIIPLSGTGNLLAAYAFRIDPMAAGVGLAVFGIWTRLVGGVIVQGKPLDAVSLGLVAAITLLGLALGLRA